jgi:hypothetical protein
MRADRPLAGFLAPTNPCWRVIDPKTREFHRA